MAFPGLGEDSSDSSSSDEEDEAQRRAAWQKVLDNIAAEAEELGGRYREARVQVFMAFPGLLGLREDSSDSSSSDEDDEEQRRAAWQKVLDNIAAEAGELAGRYRGAGGARVCKAARRLMDWGRCTLRLPVCGEGQDLTSGAAL